MILRALLALIAWLLALLPPGTLASIPRTAFLPPPVARFGVEFSNEQDCGPLTLHLDGLHDRAGPCGGVLVRQNPWSKFDPEGLNETFGWNNPIADYLAPDPVGSYNEAGRQLGTALDSSAGGFERAGGAAGYLGHGMSCLLDCIPGVGNLKRAIVKKIGVEVAEHAGEKIIKEGAEQLAKHAVGEGAERFAKKGEVAVEKTAKQTVEESAEQASKAVNGNSKASTKAQHGYEIVDTHNGDTVAKTGVSGQPLKDGASPRANKQANQWNKEPGNEGRYEPRVVKEVPEGPGARQKILDWEKANADKNRATLDDARHQRP